LYQEEANVQAENPRSGCATVKEAAAYLGLSMAKVYQLMAAGQLPFVKLGKCRRITWKALDELVERSTVPAAGTPR
jgi:excisionase family DNA binding protein